MAQLSVTIGVLVTLAQTLAVPPTTARQTGPSSPDRARMVPFQRLFTPTTTVTSPQVAGVQTGSRVVCGMLVVPADSTVDPGMLRPVPTDVTFAVRSIVPPICKD